MTLPTLLPVSLSSQWGTRVPIVAGGLLLLTLLVPSPAAPVFRGMPVFTIPSAIALLIAIVYAFCCASSSAKSRIVRLLALVILGTAGVGVVAKMLILNVPAQGFAACYQVGPVASEPCDPAFGLTVGDRTRVDPVIDFGPSRNGGGSRTVAETNWQLGSINRDEYNYYGEGVPDRLRLPFSVAWTGVIDESELPSLSYVGEGSLTLDGRTMELQAAYARPMTVELPSTAGMLTLDLSWQPTSESDLFAEARLLSATGDPVTVASVNQETVLVGWLAAALILIAIAAALASLFLNFRRSPFVLIVLLGGTALLGVLLIWDPFGRPAPLLGPLMILAIVGIRWVATRHSAWVVALWLLPLTALTIARSWAGTLTPSIVYRDAGSDFRRYVGQARDLLIEGTLRGGEDVFYYSPGMRYFLFSQYSVLGENDTLIAATGITFLLLGTWFAYERLVFTRLGAGPLLPQVKLLWRCDRSAQMWLLASGGVVFMLALYVWSPFVLEGSRILLSEYLTWIGLLFALPLAVTATRVSQLAVVSVILGVSLVLRGNHVLAVAVILLILAVRVHRRSLPFGQSAAAALAPLGLIAFLVPLHNFVYGGVWQFAQSSPNVSPEDLVPLPPSRVADIFTDTQVAQILQWQIAGVFVVPSWWPEADAPFSAFFIALIRLAQLGIVVALVSGIVHRFKGPWASTLLTIVPLAYLVPHIFVQVYVYYPRHVVAGYLAAWLVLLAVTGRFVAESQRRASLPAT